jgi:hypothetical protein
LEWSILVQFARPNADGDNNGWTVAPLYQKIDEVIRDDSDYISSPSNPIWTQDCFILLSDVLTPANRLNHILRYTYRKSASGGRTIYIAVYLMEGITTIAGWIHENIPNTWTQAEQTLTEEQASSITDYSKLYMEFLAQVFGTGAGRSAQVSWCEFQVPDAPIKKPTGLGLTVKPL